MNREENKEKEMFLKAKPRKKGQKKVCCKDCIYAFEEEVAYSGKMWNERS